MLTRRTFSQAGIGPVALAAEVWVRGSGAGVKAGMSGHAMPVATLAWPKRQA